MFDFSTYLFDVSNRFAGPHKEISSYSLSRSFEVQEILFLDSFGSYGLRVSNLSSLY